MRRSSRALVLAVVCWGLGAAFADGGFAVRAQLVRVTGVVKIQRQGRGPWITVTKRAHRLLYAGDHVQTQQQSSAEVLVDGARISLGPRTHVIIPSADAGRAPRGASRLWVVAGRVFVWLIGTRSLELGTEGATAAASGTRFAMDVEPGGPTVLTVFEGVVVFYNELGSVAVSAGEQSSARRGAAPTRPMRVDPSQAIQWEPSLEGIWLGLEARFFPAQTVGELEQLAAQAAERAAGSPADLAAQLRAAQLLCDALETPRAIEMCERAVSLDPSSLEARLCLGLCWLQEGEATRALAAFRDATAIAPQRTEPRVGQAAALLLSRGPDSLGQAEATVEQALALEPDNPLALTMLGVLAMRRGDAVAAREALAKAVSGPTPPYQAYAYLAAVQLADSDVQGALASARTAVGLAPGSGLARESLATALFFGGDSVAARGEIERALEANPNSATGHLLLSDILVQSGDMDGGLREAQLAVSLDPLLAPAYHALGMIFLAENALAQAERAFSRALELSPTLVAARTGMGVTYARQGRLAQALEAQQAAVALDSSRASTHNNLGAALLSLGALAQAADEFREALRLQPSWALPRANLALAYLEMNRFADAVREGEAAVRLGADSARTHTTLARVYLKQNRTNKAWAALRRALELDKDYALAHLQMAEVYVRQGRAREAVNHQLQGIIAQPSAILDSRAYSRTEVSGDGGSLAASAKQDGRGDNGQNSYFLRAAYESNDDDRPHSRYERASVLAIAGRQDRPGHTRAVLASLQQENRDRPGAEVTGGGASDPNYTSAFHGGEAHYLTGHKTSRGGDLTLRLGYRNSILRDNNPDALTAADSKPFRDLRVQYQGPSAELRLDQPLGHGVSLVAGVAATGEKRRVSGTMGRPSAPGGAAPITWTPFFSSADRDAATVYAEAEGQVSSRMRVLVGGRLVTREGMEPVLRPRANVRYETGPGRTLVVLTRPILADDVSELSPVDDWATPAALSPLDFALGGFAQSYELQYQLMPTDGSLLRLSAFYRSLHNYVVDMQDPQWAPGEVGVVLGSGNLRGVDVEWERWVGRDLSVGAWIRYVESNNDEASGLEIPYVPDIAGQLRLDYLDSHGWRLALVWNHVGRRYADAANAVELNPIETVDLAMARQLNLHTDVHLTLENAFNEGRGFWDGYPVAGRTVRAGVLYRF